MQKWASKILASFAIIFAAWSASAQPLQNQIESADSLFKARQFTQSLELYQQIFDDGLYSPAMLLRMSLIEEALGNVDKSLYYLDLAYLETHQEAILAKMDEVAAKNGLDGYRLTSTERILFWVDEHRLWLGGGVVLLLTSLLGAILWKRYRSNTRPYGLFAAFALTVVLLAVGINYPFVRDHGILTTEPIYLMSGPSSGANVIAILKPGHRIAFHGDTDVWVKVMWNEKVGYVKRSQLLPVHL